MYLRYNNSLGCTPPHAGLSRDKCDSIMEEHAKSRLQLNGVIETSKTVQKAKFRARLNYLQEKLVAATQQSEDLYKLKMEVERKHLEWALLLYCELILKPGGIAGADFGEGVGSQGVGDHFGTYNFNQNDFFLGKQRQIIWGMMNLAPLKSIMMKYRSWKEGEKCFLYVQLHCAMIHYL